MDQALFGSIKPEKKLRLCIIFFKEATLWPIKFILIISSKQWYPKKLVPLASDSSLSALANNGRGIGTMHKNQDHTIETHKKSFARHEANHGQKGKCQQNPKEEHFIKIQTQNNFKHTM